MSLQLVEQLIKKKKKRKEKEKRIETFRIGSDIQWNVQHGTVGLAVYRCFPSLNGSFAFREC